MTDKNIAETIEDICRKPFALRKHGKAGVYAFPNKEGWSLQAEQAPDHKYAEPRFDDVDSFISYVKRHQDADKTTIWADVRYSASPGDRRMDFQLKAILNDNAGADVADWRDHVATFDPDFSYEFNAWMTNNGERMAQIDFARFLENHQTDIASQDGFPTSADILQMAQNFQSHQDFRFTKSVRLQDGGVEMLLSQKESDATVEKMKVFEKFCVGIPVFYRGDAFPIYARLRWRHPDGQLSFWYELVRPDLAFEEAVNTMVAKVKDALPGLPLFFGAP